MRWIRKFAAEERGATLIEYGLIIGLIVIAMFASLHSFAGVSVGMWNNVSSKVASAS